ncbi:hypothetical protein ACFQV2_01665 [Actinokineospora soli]|uniref:Translation initiation factor IF-2 n=1 Tax=Actinokineospora soli TaxID=1048753 RepID=A0ABW2TI83_9PSEU
MRPVAADRSAPPRVISRRAPEPVAEAPLSAAAEAVRGRRAVDSAVTPPSDQARGKRAAESGVFPPAKPDPVPSYGDLTRGEPTRGKRAAASGVFPPVAKPEAEPARGKRAAASGVFPPVEKAEGDAPRGKRAAESGVFPPARPGSAAAAARAGRRAAVDSGTFQPVAEPQDAGGRRRKPEADAEPQGTHASGTSVAELLAAHGGATPRHRRRRDED